MQSVPWKRYSARQLCDHPWVRGEDVKQVPLRSGVLDAIRTINDRAEFSKLAQHVVSASLTAPQLQELRAVFFEIDKEGKGWITCGTWHPAPFDSFGPSPPTSKGTPISRSSCTNLRTIDAIHLCFREK